MNNKATLFLIPIPVAEDANETLSMELIKVVPTIKYFFVENLRTARRFLKSVDKIIDIDTCHFIEIDKHNGIDYKTFKDWLKEGRTIGIMSEAGCPGIADPGSDLVMLAHEYNAKVLPLTGPSSLFLALMASGLNGQKFAFHGYIALKHPLRRENIIALEQQSKKENLTQIIIETPYRNDQLMADLLKQLAPNTKLCIAKNVSSKDSFIKTKKVADWKNQTIEIGKVPCVFLLLA